MGSELYTLGHAAAPSLPPLSQSPLDGHRRTSLRFSDLGGLKIQTCLPSRMIMSTRSTSDAHSCRIVSNPQQTAVEVGRVTESTWEALVVSCQSLVLVEFWAAWCGPCRTLQPVVDKLAKQYAGKLKCYKINTDEFPSIPTRYGIRSIPTIVMFKNGEEIDTIVGAVPESTLATCIHNLL